MAGQLTDNEGVLSGQYALVLCDFMSQRGFTAEQVLANTQISLTDLQQHPDHLLSYQALLQLIVNLHALDSSPTLAFELGMHLTVSNHGFLGYAVQASPTLGDALILVTRYAEIRTTLLSLTVEQGTDETNISVDDNGILGVWLAPVTETLLGCFLAIGTELLGDVDGHQLHLELPFSLHPNLRAILQLQNIQIRSDCPKVRIRFPSAWLNTSFQRPDPNLVRLAVTHCDKALNSTGQQPDWISKVGKLTRTFLADPQAQEKVAAALNMTPRTLHRRLQSNQLNFKTLIDNLRRSHALERLRYSHDPISHIALELGYSDQSNFVRAFKRWTDMTPKQFRDQ